MALKTVVKVGEITNLSDARYCAGMGVDMLGFNLDPDSTGYISPEQFAEITEWIAGVKLVGELSHSNDLNKLLMSYELDMIQLPHDEIEPNLPVDLPIIASIETDKPTEINQAFLQLAGQVEYFLLDHPAVVDLVDELNQDVPILLGGDFELRQVDHLLNNVRLSGISLKGSVEEKPGFKDYDQLADILEALENED